MKTAAPVTPRVTPHATPRVTPIVALDFRTVDTALQMVDLLGERCGFYKVGSELFTVAGPSVVRTLVDRGKRVFLDLKFHDIPNTVERAVAAAAGLGVSIVTVHASGGTQMMSAAVRAAGPVCEVFGVTVLTSLTGAELGAIWGGGGGGGDGKGPGAGKGESRFGDDLAPHVLRLALLASEAGAAGVVCSGLEAPVLRERFGSALSLLVPGVRLPGSDRGDQSRIVTPAEAASAGASYVVLGRTVTAAPDPIHAMDQAVASLR